MFILKTEPNDPPRLRMEMQIVLIVLHFKLDKYSCPKYEIAYSIKVEGYGRCYWSGDYNCRY